MATTSGSRVATGDAASRRAPPPADFDEREVELTDPGEPLAAVAAWMTTLDGSRAQAIEDATAGFPFALRACAPIEQAAALMAYEGVSRVAVVSERGLVIGMVTALDVARAVAVAAGYAICARR